MSLFASWFNSGNSSQVGRQFGGVEGFDVQGDEADGGDAEINGTVGAIHDHGDSDHSAAVRTNNVQGFLNATALGHHVFDDEDFFAGRDFESAAQDEFAFLFFDKNEAQAKLAGNFLADHQSAHGGGNHGDGAEGPQFVSQGRAEFFNDGHLLQGQGALEKLATVQSASQNEMALQQGAGITKNLQGFVLSHAGILVLKPEVQSLFCFTAEARSQNKTNKEGKAGGHLF
jgi:hypothetical protein